MAYDELTNPYPSRSEIVTHLLENDWTQAEADDLVDRNSDKVGTSDYREWEHIIQQEVSYGQ
ncbi:hypothetical protein PBI_TRISCUIT_71 [Microbacterium phage Triscuit]|nr:hypothetical protein PBI_TRISCUIT_71 [Microbacterium phage Triscuit]